MSLLQNRKLKIKNKLPKVLIEILIQLQLEQIKPVLVGGCVRDYLLNLPSKDYDIELFNVESLDIVQNILEKFGTVKQVGKNFGVLILKIQNFYFDFALARLEKKRGQGHKDFEVTIDSNLSFKEASLRRDFTINSIGYDYFEDKFLDPNKGIEDLKQKRLRHIKNETFVEDSLRVFRAIQFVARFDLSIDEKTFSLCKKIVQEDELKYLPKERVYEEFKKLFLKSPKPSLGFELLKELGALKYFPELKALVDCIQDKEYHPEGDVWIHTLMTIDEMAKILEEKKIEEEYKKLYLFYAILCHDLGKPFCTETTKEGRVTSYKHESLGIEPTISFLSRLTDEKRFIEKIVPLVKNHLAPFQLYKAESSLKAVKRLSLKCSIEDLCIVCLADCKGRIIPNKDKCDKAISWVLQKARELNISAEGLKPLVQGRDLIALGLKPGKEFKDILEYALNLQIDENFEKEKILEEIKKHYGLIT